MCFLGFTFEGTEIRLFSFWVRQDDYYAHLTNCKYGDDARRQLPYCRLCTVRVWISMFLLPPITVCCNISPKHVWCICNWRKCKNNTQSSCSFLSITSLTAPCVPRNTKGYLDCVSNSAWVTWDASDGALSYFVLAKGIRGHNSSCTTTSSSCQVPDLKCGMLYTFSVTGVNKQCYSNRSTTFDLETGI